MSTETPLPFRDRTLPVDQRVDDLLGRLTTEEKLALTHGRFLSGGVPRLGIPQLEVADGPVGIRMMGTQPVHRAKGDDEVEDTGSDREGPPPRTTALPATLLLAATWDRRRAHDYANVIAEEMLATGKHLLLAPGINLMRDPRGGRNFEYFGEDPFLVAEMAIGYVTGLQDRRVGADLKHFAANESDRDRHYTSSEVDAATLREVYLYPFERAIREADAWSVMTGNNLVNGVHVAESVPLLKEYLRGELDYQGVVLTDWRSAYRAAESAAATLDMTTGFCGYVYENGLGPLVESGALPMGDLDSMVRRILRLYLRCGVIDGDREAGALDSPDHRKAARQIAAEGMVLLRNEDGLLPFTADGNILLGGPGATEAEIGTGSGLVNGGAGNASPWQGLCECWGADRVVALESGSEIGPHDLAVYCANAPRGGEGDDASSIALPGNQEDEIRELAARTNRLVVLLQTGSAVDLSRWHDAPSAILVAWYGGQEMGHAVADLLSGKSNPSGKLPCTFGNAIDDYPAAVQETWPARLVLDEHPGKPGFTPETRKQVHALSAEYTEGPLIGYRWFDRMETAPLFPFGYGLSYTRFELAEPTVEESGDGPEQSWEVRCRVRNVGDRAGAEVVQLYVESPNGDTTSPVRILRGFDKIPLQPGESGQAVIRLNIGDLARYDPENGGWVTDAGAYRLHIGQSSRDLPWVHQVAVPAEIRR